MIALAFVSLIIAYSFVLIGIYVIKLNPRESLNKLAAIIYFCFAIWSLCYTFLNIAPTAEAAMQWHRLGSFGWVLFCPFATHFYLILSEKTKKWKKIWIYILIYALPAAIVINALFNPNGTSVASGFAQRASGEGWSYITNIKTIWYWINLLHLIVYFAIALGCMQSWARKSKRRRFIKQAKSVLLLNTFVLFVGSFLDLGLPILYPNVPPLCHFVAFFWGLGYLYIIKYLKLLSPLDAATPDIILETVLDPILVLNSEGVIIKCNQATEDTLKLSSKQIIDRPLSDFFKAKEYAEERFNRLLTSKKLRNEVIDLIDSAGSTINTRASFSAAESKLDGVVGIVVNMHDVTPLIKAEQELSESNNKYIELSRQLEKLANYDALTGLPNRRILIEKVDSAISEFESSGRVFALAFIDIDRFKAVNDLYGHDIGDKLLQKIAEIFKSCIRKTDFVTRVGGDEFILFLDLEDALNADELVQRIKSAFYRPIVIENCLCDIGVSLGISKCPEDGVTRDELMRVADNRMYFEKANKITRTEA